MTLQKIMVAAVVAIFLSLAGPGAEMKSEGAEDPGEGFTVPDKANYTDLGWAEAFSAANGKLSREYAFTDWKRVDWSALSARYLPLIEQAEASHDEIAYYQIGRAHV